METRHAYWDRVYTEKMETAVSWYERHPVPSHDLILHNAPVKGNVIDIGGGASFLPDHLFEAGFSGVTSLDLSAVALARVAHRLARYGDRHRCIVADVTRWSPDRHYDVWHDRAALHFLTDPEDQKRYGAALRSALAPGGIAVIGGFAPNGPSRCSGLPVIQHDSASLLGLLGDEFIMLQTCSHNHTTPTGMIQQFEFTAFRKLG